MRPTRKSQRKFPSGWCASANHSHCRGAYNNPGSKTDPIWYCECKCHRGKKISEPEPEHRRVLNPRLEEHAESDEWVGQCIAYTHFEIPVPDQETATKIQARINRASKRAGVRITTQYKDGQVHCKVAKNQTRPTRKSSGKALAQDGARRMSRVAKTLKGK
jgi:hypothetical protein